MGRRELKLSRTGCSTGASVQIWEWHVMHVWVSGIPASAVLVTVVWQYWQSMPNPPTWCWWLNGTAWSSGRSTWVA